jgi:hypothetical protein
VLVVLFGLGGVVAWQVSDTLGIDMRPADIPVIFALTGAALILLGAALIGLPAVIRGPARA